MCSAVVDECMLGEIDLETAARVHEIYMATRGIHALTGDVLVILDILFQAQESNCRFPSWG
jgi:hypothetical protein